MRGVKARLIRWGSVLGLAIAILFGVTAVSAQTTAIVDANGSLTITLSDQDDSQITCINNQVKINGLDPSNGIFSCDQITGINIEGGVAANDIQLGNVTPIHFPNLESIIVDAKGGDDRIAASAFSDTISGGTGDDLFTGIQLDDQVNGGTGQNLYAEATQPLGPGPSVQSSEKPTPPTSPSPLAPDLISNIAGIDFDTNAFNSGTYNIPPDPSAASGPNHVVSVVNVSIQWHTKAGTLQGNQSLRNFFTSLSPVNNTFDPKVIYDQYEDRFVVVTLERQNTANGDPSNTSRILVAVSATSDPNGTWYFHSINSLTNIGGNDTWADYPGFAVDEEAIYITNNMFLFSGGSSVGVRLWIIDKGVVGGFYAGSAASDTIYDPIPASGQNVTTQPAHIFDSGPTGVGTFLVGYSGLSNGVSEFIQVVRVDNPLTTPIFTLQFVNIGDIENPATGMPNAPQQGTATFVETNDRRALHAVWRNNSLWLTTTIVAPLAPDAGQATAYWVELDTTTLASISVNDQGSIGGEDLGAGTYTFFPSVAVDPCGNAGFGFAASGPNIYPGAYYTVRYASDTAGTVQSTGTVAAGTDYYFRQFGDTRNRWGDYTGMSLDPANEATFWAFNEYAMTRGTILISYPTQDGRWATEYGSFPSGIDFGDLPTSYTLTNFSDDGARHCIGGPYLGTTPTADGDGKEDPDALGDTDEGVTRQPSANGASTNGGWTDGLVSNGDGGRVDVIVGGSSGTVDAFIDFGSGTLTATPLLDCSTGTALTMPLSVGTQQTCFNIPDNTFSAPIQPIRMRLRISTLGTPNATSLATDGEVEDYSWNFGPTAVTLNNVETSQSSEFPSWILATITLLTIFLFLWSKRKKTLA